MLAGEKQEEAKALNTDGLTIRIGRDTDEGV